MVWMMKASSESVPTLVGDGGRIEGNEPTSSLHVVERTRLSTLAPCHPGNTTRTMQREVEFRPGYCG